MNEQREQHDTPMLFLGKDPDDGICNLCLKHFDQLSEEHVPPQCTGNSGTGTYSNCFPELQRTIQQETYSEGISYHTVCRECNEELGNRYDRAISKLYGTVRHNQRDQDLVRVRVQPNAILRGVMGHFVAAKTTHRMSASDEVFRLCAQEPAEPIPDNYHFYVIYYPQRTVRIVRDLLMIPNITQDIRVLCNIVKIDPLAFVITDQPFFGERFADWHQYAGIDWKREENVTISKRESIPFSMPEADGRFVRVMGAYAYQSVCATIDTRAR